MQLLKGTVRVAPGFDLTQPADPELERRIDHEVGSLAEQALGDRMLKSDAMTLGAFRRSLSKRTPPSGLPPALVALWWQGKDDWDRAHAIVMDEPGKDCAWVHAHLHRVEGDLGNARYWYKQAAKPAASGALKAEWAAIVGELLAKVAQQ